MKEMVARFNGTCRGCGQAIHAGDHILWSKQTGALHNGACLDAYWGDEFGRQEAAQERAAYEAEMEWEAREIAREEAEYLSGYHEVAAIQAVTTAGSALREQMYLEMEQRDYNLYG